MSRENSRYGIITPAHNEAEFLPKVIDAVGGQQPAPSKWLILDDRSTDRTLEIASQAAEKYPFIEVVSLGGEGQHVLGSHVARIVNQGLEYLPGDLDFIVKLDADIVPSPDYFATIINRMQANPRLGIASGKLFIPHGGQWLEERFPDFHVPGACKTYRRDCFADTGGILPLYGWDILDCTKARMLGWQTRSYDDLVLYHLRMLGSKRGIMRGHLGHGRGMWAIRAHPLFVLARALYRATEPPYFSGLLIMAGYLQACLAREPRLEDRGLARFLRKEQLSRLLGKHIRQERIVSRRLP